MSDLSTDELRAIASVPLGGEWDEGIRLADGVIVGGLGKAESQ